MSLYRPRGVGEGAFCYTGSASCVAIVRECVAFKCPSRAFVAVTWNAVAVLYNCHTDFCLLLLLQHGVSIM